LDSVVGRGAFNARADAGCRRLEGRRVGCLGLKLRIGHRPFDQPIAVRAHAAQIDLRRGNASRRLQNIGIGAFADDPMREGFDVARQIRFRFSSLTY
jgi:hypothetical protein